MSTTNGAATPRDLQGVSCTCGKRVPDDYLAREGASIRCSCGERWRIPSLASQKARAEGLVPFAASETRPERSTCAPSVPRVVASAHEAAEKSSRKLGWLVKVAFAVECDADSFADAWKASGLHDEDVVGIHKRGALGRALRSLKVEGAEPCCEGNDDASVVYALTSKVSDQDGKARENIQRVTYDRTTKRLAFGMDFRNDEIQAAYDRCAVTLPRDKMNKSARNALARAKGVPCLGAIFVPLAGRKVIDDLLGLVSRLAAIGVEGRVSVLAISEGDEETKREVARDASEHFSKELEELEKLLADDVERSRQGKAKVRVSTFLSRQKAALVVRERALAYKETVELDAAKIVERVEALSRAVSDLEAVADAD